MGGSSGHFSKVIGRFMNSEPKWSNVIGRPAGLLLSLTLDDVSVESTRFSGATPSVQNVKCWMYFKTKVLYLFARVS